MVNFPGKDKYGVEDLRQIVEILRGEDGCPWDKVQTHDTLRRELLEETAELCEAIDLKDFALMREELGDVLLQLIFHASIERQNGRFDLDDVADAECRKMIARHPHVFAGETVSGVEEELSIWEARKRVEKGQATAADAMDAVCRTLPGLWRAEKLQKKAANGAPETGEAEALCAALRDSTDALEAAFDTPDAEKALGALLYAAVRAARRAGLDPEAALHAECERQIEAQRSAESVQ